MSENTEFFKPCNMCKKPIGWNTVYYMCNVSTCNRKRTGLVFCTVSCWDAHVPGMNHKESWAVEFRAPKNAQEHAALETAAMERKRIPKESAPVEAPKAASQKPVVILRRKIT